MCMIRTNYKSFSNNTDNNNNNNKNNNNNNNDNKLRFNEIAFNGAFIENRKLMPRRVAAPDCFYILFFYPWDF